MIIMPCCFFLHNAAQALMRTRTLFVTVPAGLWCSLSLSFVGTPLPSFQMVVVYSNSLLQKALAC